MSIYTKILRQAAVWWSKGSNLPDDFGATQFSEPVEIKCRWDVSRAQVLRSDGQTLLSEAQVFVDRDMQEGDVLWLGELVDVVDAVVPLKNPLAFAVQKFEKIGNIRQTKFVRLAYL